MPETPTGNKGRIAVWTAAGVALVGGLWVAYRPRRTARGRPRQGPSAQALALGFEPHDVDAGIIARILLVLAVGATICVGAVFLMIGLLQNADQARYAGITEEQAAPLEPPLPHLQVRPFAELADNQAREDHRLQSYAWLDAAHTRARIPIGQAMSLVTGQSLDAKP